jgi:hypothetical protein
LCSTRCNGTLASRMVSHTTAVYDRRSARSRKNKVPEVKWCTAAPAVARPIAPVSDLRRILEAIETSFYVLGINAKERGSHVFEKDFVH